MPWIVGGAAIGSALIGADAAKGAAGAQAGATNAATAEQRRQFDLVRSDQAPFRDAGVSALEWLRRMLGMDTPRVGDADIRGVHDRFNTAYQDLLRRAQADEAPDFAGELKALQQSRDDEIQRLQARQGAQSSAPFGDLSRKYTVDDFWADPVTKLGFQFGLDEGRKGLERIAPLTTGRDSGAMLKELTKFGTDYTGTKAGESFSRFEGEKSNVFNRLMALIGGGQVANQVNANAGMNTASNIGNLLTAGANAQGAAKIAGANAFTGGLSSIANWWNQQNTLDRLFPRNTPRLMDWGSSGDFGTGGYYA